MIILGLDPGLATTGYGLIESTGSKYKLLDYGVLLTQAKTPFSKRLNELSDMVMALFKKYEIDEVAIEDLFFSTNRKTAMSVAQARGVLVLTAEQHKKPNFSYTPSQVKSGICGYGGADKQQMQYMVKKLLNLTETPKPDDAADALAIAICHSHSRKMVSL